MQHYQKSYPAAHGILPVSGRKTRYLKLRSPAFFNRRRILISHDITSRKIECVNFQLQIQTVLNKIKNNQRNRAHIRKHVTRVDTRCPLIEHICFALNVQDSYPLKSCSYTAIMYSENISQICIPHYRPLSSRYVHSEHSIDVLNLQVIQRHIQLPLMTFYLTADSSVSERQSCNGVNCN